MNNLRITTFASDESSKKCFQGWLHAAYSRGYCLLKEDFSLVLGSPVQEGHGPFREGAEEVH